MSLPNLAFTPFILATMVCSVVAEVVNGVEQDASVAAVTNKGANFDPPCLFRESLPLNRSFYLSPRSRVFFHRATLVFSMSARTSVSPATVRPIFWPGIAVSKTLTGLYQPYPPSGCILLGQ